MNNEFENNMNETQFEDMRQQMNTLKNKLNQQEIVNDRIIRRSMKKTVGNITRRYYMIMALGILMIPYGYWVFIKLCGLSMAFWIGTSIFMLVCAGATYYNSLNLSDSGMMSHSLVEARRKVARAKKFDSNWLLVGIPALILWLGWLCYEVYLKENHAETDYFFWGGFIVGTILGTFLGLTTHFKTQRQYQEIIDQIEDLTTES